jgi:cell division protein FtsN
MRRQNSRAPQRARRQTRIVRMPARPRALSPQMRTVRFWLIVFAVCGIASLASYRVGRDWLGKRLADVKMGQGAPQILAQGGVNAEDGTPGDETKAPDKAQVTVEERQPTTVEVQRAKEGGDVTEPQDGAELNTQKDQVKAPDDDQSLVDQGNGDDGTDRKRYLVTAGSYEDEANASRIVARLASKGYKPQVETVTRNGKAVRRVTVAVVQGKAEAEDLQTELAAEGVEAEITPAH